MQDTEVCLQIVTNVVFYKSPGAHKSRRPFCSVPAGSWVEKPEYYAQILKGFWWHSNDNFANTTTIYLSQALVDCSQSPIFFREIVWAPLTYFNDGGSEGFFWVWHFGQKGFFGVYERRRNFLRSREQHRDFFWVLYYSSAQINNLLLVWYNGIFLRM